MTAAEPVEAGPVEPDLIDRIALALPEEVRAEYYRELLHCRSLPDSDEMLRLLRAMQFLVLLIEQAPSRVAQERERLDRLLGTAIVNMRKIGAASETFHLDLERKLKSLPADIARGISPVAVASQINENLKQEFIRSTIPKTAEALGAISGRMETVCSEFTTTADKLGNAYRSAAEDARKAVASLKAETSEATATAERFTSAVARTFSEAYRWMLILITGGALVIGVATGMALEHWILSPPTGVAASTAQVRQPAPQPTQATPVTPPGRSGK